MKESQKTCVYWAICIGSTIFILGLIISLSLYFSGYSDRNQVNDRVIKTTCKIMNHTITEAICYRKCHCYPVCNEYCSTDVNGSRSCNRVCHNQCSQCPYTCFEYTRIAEYTTKNKQVRIYTETSGKMDLRTDAERMLDNKPVGYQYICYYDPQDSSYVLTSLHDVQGWLIASIFFFVITSIGCLILLYGLGHIGISYLQELLQSDEEPDLGTKMSA